MIRNLIETGFYLPCSLLALLLVLLSACGTNPLQPADKPAPVVARPIAVVPPAAQSNVEVIAYRPTPQTVYARPEPVKAVQVLQRRAADQQAAGQLVAAAGSLERALRIEPRSPVLWNQLAHVRLAQKQYSLAAALAAKSSAYTASEDVALQRDNQAIIAKVK